MPYLPQADRERVQADGARTCRELTYLITSRLILAQQAHANPLALSKMHQSLMKIVMAYGQNGPQDVFTVILGALAVALMEFDRRSTKHFGADEEERRAIARVLSKVVHEFYVAVVVPEQTKQIADHGDLYL